MCLVENYFTSIKETIMPFTPTVSNFGSVNNAGNDLALFLKVASGEVIASFDRTTQFSDKHTVKSITSGKSAQFPKSGRLSAASKYLARGDAVTNATVPYAEENITIDGQLYESVFLAKQDEAFSHFDTRQTHTKQLGESLAQYWDSTVAQVGILAARAANSVTSLPGGGEVTNAAASTDGSELFKALFAARQTLDEKDVKSMAYAYLKPLEYYLLVQEDRIVSREYNDSNGGFDTGLVKGIAGMEVVRTNNLPQSNITGTIGGKYDVDASNVSGLVMTKEAVGTVKLMDIVTEMDYMTEYQAWLMVSTMMVGHGILQPECAVEINTVAN
jgi:hypothetical protein